ncbi:MAG: hypothetical protein ACE5IG_02920 [Dehalococcoidia bacterium]
MTVTRVSLTLPNGVALAVEASEGEPSRELLTLLLRELSSELARLGNGLAGAPPQPAVVETPAPTPTPTAAEQSSGHGFAGFCRRVNPVGDMRRVVVAAEGAQQLLGMERVSARELEGLFQQAGWPRPKDFVQTLRNAARSKFRWLERVPGQEGYYTVTDQGRQEVVGQA